MNEVAKTASEIATKSATDPNYLPIVLLVLCLAGFAWQFKWLVGRLDQQTSLLASLFEKANAGQVKVTEVVAINNELVKECRDTIRENTEFWRSSRDSNRKVSI
jgi:hypothetical protein